MSLEMNLIFRYNIAYILFIFSNKADRVNHHHGISKEPKTLITNNCETLRTKYQHHWSLLSLSFNVTQFFHHCQIIFFYWFKVIANSKNFLSLTSSSKKTNGAPNWLQRLKKYGNGTIQVDLRLLFTLNTDFVTLVNYKRLGTCIRACSYHLGSNVLDFCNLWWIFDVLFFFTIPFTEFYKRLLSSYVSGSYVTFTNGCLRVILSHNTPLALRLVWYTTYLALQLWSSWTSYSTFLISILPLLFSFCVLIYFAILAKIVSFVVLYSFFNSLQ